MSDAFDKLAPMPHSAARIAAGMATVPDGWVHEKVYAEFGELAGKFRTNPSVWAARSKIKYAAKLSDVVPLMHCGDGGWFSGEAFHSYLIRIGEFSNISHAWMVERTRSREIRNLEVIEFKGGQNTPLAEQVAKYPGQYFWAPVNRAAFPHFDGNHAARAAREMVDRPYGRIAVWCNGLTHVAGLRGMFYWLYLKHKADIDAYFATHPPFCSGAQKLWAIKGGQDPVPGRPAWLTTPADTFESLLWGTKLAIYPG